MDENVEDMMATCRLTNTLGTMNSDYHVAAVVVDMAVSTDQTPGLIEIFGNPSQLGF